MDSSPSRASEGRPSMALISTARAKSSKIQKNPQGWKVPYAKGAT